MCECVCVYRHGCVLVHVSPSLFSVCSPSGSDPEWSSHGEPEPLPKHQNPYHHVIHTHTLTTIHIHTLTHTHNHTHTNIHMRTNTRTHTVYLIQSTGPNIKCNPSPDPHSHPSPARGCLDATGEMQIWCSMSDAADGGQNQP